MVYLDNSLFLGKFGLTIKPCPSIHNEIKFTAP